MRSDVRIGLLVLVLLLGLHAPAVANPCADGGSLWPAPGPEDEGGIGGTGLIAPPEGGLGGTGHAPESQGGLGGTGVRTEGESGDGGIGGTGVQAAGDGEDREGGIGGTGVESAAARTGILGTVTGFASICVSGIEVHVDTASRIVVDGKETTPGSLALGDVVEVVASGSGDTVNALEIRSDALAVGPVTAVDAAGGELTVAGQRVVLTRSTWAADGPAASDRFAAGDWVRVGGLRRPDGAIDASRVDPATPGDVVVRGSIARQGQRLFVDGTPLQFVADAAALAPGIGTVRGHWNGSAIEVETVSVDAPLVGTPGMMRVDLDGYLAHVAGESGARVGGVAVAAEPALLERYAAQRVRVVGSVDPAGRIRVESITAARPRFAVPRPPRPAGMGGSTRAGQVPEVREAPPAVRPPDARRHGAPDARVVRPAPLPPRGLHAAKPPRPPQVHRAPPVLRPPRPPRPQP